MTFNAEQIKALQAPLDPKHVKPPPQGKYGEYVEGFHVLMEANRIFGHDGWHYAVTELRLTNATEDAGKHRVGYLAIVSATACGVTRSDVGHGQGFGKSEGDAHDSAVKEAVTDALKRALRSFGNTFGLALYDKTKSNVSAPPVELITDAQRDEIAMMADAAGVSLQRICEAAKIQSLKDMPAAKFAGVKSKLNATLEKNKEAA